MKNIIFRPTNNCNLACKYCYDKNNHEVCDKLRDNATNKFLENENLLVDGINKLFENEKQPKLIFHGGEPLLVRSEVLSDFCKKLNYNNNINYSIQTNGTLIDKDTIKLFNNYKFNVGISLDGCNEKQNNARVYINNRNTFNTVMKKIKLLKENNIRTGLVMSVSKNHISQEKELYDFIANNNIHCNIRPVFNATGDFEKSILTDKEYIDFFNNLFDIWFDDKEKRVGTRQIHELYDALKEELDINYKPPLCNKSKDCFKSFISLDVEGELHSCNRLYGVEKFHYGNINNMTIEEIQNCINILCKEREKTINNKCSNCERLDKCYGGCVAEGYDIENNIQDISCDKNIKTLIKKHIKGRLQND